MNSPSAQPPLSVQAALVLMCLILAGLLVYRYRTAQTDRAWNVHTITHYSNQWALASEKLREQKLVNLTLERSVSDQTTDLTSISNQVSRLSADLARIQANASASTEKAQRELSQRTVRISQLENQRDGLSTSIADLTETISNLETQIAETEHQLATSTTERESLTADLKRLRGHKEELEKQLSDLAALRNQMHKLQDELAVNRRLAWIRRGLYGDLKGAEKLRQTVAAASAADRKFNLDVQLQPGQPAEVAAPASP